MGFAKVQENICNILVDAQNVSNILPRPIGSNVLIVAKLKCDLKYCGHVYIDPVRMASVYITVKFMKTKNKFHEEITMSKISL